MLQIYKIIDNRQLLIGNYLSNKFGISFVFQYFCTKIDNETIRFIF